MYTKNSHRIKYLLIVFVAVIILWAGFKPMLFKTANTLKENGDSNNVEGLGLKEVVRFDLSKCPTMSSKPVEQQPKPEILQPMPEEPKPKTDDQKTIETVQLPDKIPSFHPSNVEKITPSSQLYSGAKHDKWIVLTTISLPTDDVKFLANMTGWKVVVVGDTKTPNEWRYSNCIYLSVEKQLELGLSLPALLPTKHYARKNAGYLYAIANGATVIYETDDDNRPVDNFASFEIGPTMSGLMFSGGSYSFNPYRHFGQPTLWPRGYPLGQIGADVRDEYRLSEHWPTPAMQQGVVNGDPDMDAVFRLTRKITLKPLDVSFDPVAPSVILPPGIFSPFNTQNTLFLKDAFWGLLIPTTTTFRMCDIWRGYWSQRLLWEIGGNLGFFTPNAYQKRNAHDYMADMVDEKLMYFDTDRLLMFLSKWVCPAELSFFQCVYQLTADMAVEKFWLEKDIIITQNWLEDLVRIGYPEPTRINVEKLLSGNEKLKAKINPKELTAMSDLQKSQNIVTLKGSAVRFAAALQFSPRIVPKVTKSLQAVKQAQVISSVCPSLTSLRVPTHSMKSLKPGDFHDLLLVVVYNSPVFKNTRLLEAMYRPLFPNIVYCGNDLSKFETETLNVQDNGLTFAEISQDIKGRLNLLCTVKAMEMKYHVKGYMVIGHDVLLNVWNLRGIDKNKVWIQKPNLSNLSVSNQKMYEDSIESLKAIQETEVKLYKKPSEFVVQLATNNGGVNKVADTTTDAFYVPKRLRQDILFYTNYFAHKTSIEGMSLAHILQGMEDAKYYHYFNGLSLTGPDENNSLQKYSTSSHFLHPVEFSLQENIQLLCEKYFPMLLEKLNM